MPDKKKAANGCLRNIDRLSDLPDSILHHIISFLGTTQACRTSILSKRWVNIWSTGFILDFNPYSFGNAQALDFATSDRFVSFIETTMQRYSDQNLSIRKLRLACRNVNEEMTGRIDRWLQIAVKNQVEDLSLYLSETPPVTTDLIPFYDLPVILFSAMSLVSLKCFSVSMPRCPSVMLISLQSLDLSHVDIDEHMLQHIIMSCPLKKIHLHGCMGINDLSIPNCCKLELLDVDATIPSGGSIKVETSSILHFSYGSNGDFDAGWPFNFSPASKKNLTELNFSIVNIVDDALDKLMSELSSIKIMSFHSCTMTSNIRIASLTLEQLDVDYCYDLVNITIDAPQLKSFCYDAGNLQLSSVTSITSIHRICNGRLNLTFNHLNYQSLGRINTLLSRSKCFNILSIDLTSAFKTYINLDELSKSHGSSPYEIEELKLSLSRDISDKSYLIDILDGSFWRFRPTLLSLSITYLNIDEQNAIVKFLLETLQKKVECEKHPLTMLGIESTNYSSIRPFDLQLRLSW